MRSKYGELMAIASCFACLGRPLLLSKGQDPVAVKTRKALAIMGYLSRQNGHASPRESLADLLWSRTERHKAMQSLRQALRQLKTAEEEAGIDVVRSSPGHVQLDHTQFVSDLTRVLELVERGNAADFRQAEELWRGEFLAGFDDIDPEFSDWLTVERERVNSEVTSAAFKHFNRISTEDGGMQVEACGRFLLKIDPAMETAHRLLIRLYLKLGQRERAEQQLRACEREMRLHLDAEPDEETRDLLKDAEATIQQPLSVGQSEKWPIKGALPNHEDIVRLPEISIISSSLLKKGLNDAVHLREEIVSGLSSFRSFDLFESEYFGDENMPKATLVEGHELGSYLLRFRHDERTGKIVVQFEDRSNGQIVFNEIVDLRHWDGIFSVASQIVSRIHNYATGRLRNPANTSAFAKWCQAESLIWDFTPQSDEKAMRLLDDLERTNRSFSMTYAGKASIIMKQELHYPLHKRNLSQGMTGLLDMAERAIVLDPWQAVNQRVYGWTLILSKMPEEAKRAFQNAGRLSAADPANLMSVAEGLALSGDVKEARETAERAFKLFAFVPRVFYEYLANIYFAADDYENAILQIEKGTGSSLGCLTTRVAALVCSGRESEANVILDSFSEKRNQFLKTADRFDVHSEEWRQRINFFQDSRVRANFDRGAQLVQKVLFGNSK